MDTEDGLLGKYEKKSSDEDRDLVVLKLNS